MADILDLQIEDLEPTPGDEKVSNWSFFMCRNSQISVIGCYNP